jgi:hypothetical protein
MYLPKLMGEHMFNDVAAGVENHIIDGPPSINLSNGVNYLVKFF